ncbi:Hpt domain-containing protein [Pseudanabaena sp. FACHB-1998]|uniref:Hpt domain-containing protein n=1 Tax=Pseudanabaena sp. FACHB-1998 TaxID=2692858 RepID=UPI0016818679|nr:Hpt domain-containing protein [Pseudanabaena sp. FACHB-1998]MBD2177373.1 Hpt domain-containing protein [Pseudanabaena sp. FACHB-1998]
MFGELERREMFQEFDLVHNYPEFITAKTLDVSIFSSLRSSINDDLEFSDLVTIYLTSAEDLLRAIQIAFDNQDGKKLGIAAHSLKSTSASIGAIKLSYASKYIEKICKNGEMLVSLELVNLLNNEYDHVLTEIRASVIEFMSEWERN